MQAMLLLILALLLNAVLVVWCLGLYRDIGVLNMSWQRGAQASIEKAAQLAEIERRFGYDEFIHNFKNYVLRRSDDYEQRTDTSLARAFDALNAFQQLPLTARDREDLAVIRTTLEQYQARFLEAREGTWRALPPVALDKLVRVDDAPAAAAFLDLRSRLVPEFLHSMALHRDGMADAWQQAANAGLLMLPILTLNGFVFAWLVLQLRRRREDIRIVDGSCDAVLICDEKGLVVQSNPQAEKLFGYSGAELLRLRVDDLIPGCMPSDVSDVDEEGAYRNREPAVGRGLHCYTKGGQTLPVAVSVSGVRFIRRQVNMVVARRLSMPA